MRSHLTPIRTLSSKSQEVMSTAEDVKKRDPLGTLAGKVNWCSHYLKQHKGSSKIKNRNITSSSNSILGYLSKENKNTNLKIYMHPNIHRSIISNSLDMLTISMHPYEWIHYIYVCVCVCVCVCVYTQTHTHNEILLNHKKDKISSHETTWKTWRVLSLAK